MARLIPRKQIEEPQDISSSLNIRKNLFVGEDAFVSGNLHVSKSFFFGNDTGSYNSITGSVYLTGSLVIDGNFKVTSFESILSLTSSNSLTSLDTEKYSGIRARDFGTSIPTLYVSSTDGNDTNDGRSIQFPLRTIKRATQLATPGYDGRYGLTSSSLYNGYVIRVQAGTYLEDNPVIMPKNSTIWGSGLRITKILAKNKDEDLFWVNSGCYVAEVTVGGMRLYPDQINPTKGFGFAFQPGAFITTSPYIQNCSQISNQENSFAELYENIPPGGGGLYVNGDVIHPDSPLASMVLDAYTQISPNGVGCLVNGRGFIQLVSFFNNFSYYAIRVNNGGHATLNNSNISFGLYGMYSSGSRMISGSGGDLVSRDSIRSTWSCIVDVLSKGYPAGLPTASILNTNDGIKVTSEPQFFLNAGQTASQADIDEVNADFTLISEIVQSGTSNFPTLLAKSSNKGYGANSPFNILGGTQITSSISAGNYELNHISQSFGTLLGIFANGTGSYNYQPNTSASISVSDINQIPSAIVASDNITGSVSSSFETIINIIKNGLAKAPAVISNTSGSVMVSNISQFTTGESSSLKVVNSVSASFSIVYNILANGTGSTILDVPVDEQVEFNITNTNSSSFNFEGFGENPTLTLFRGETYKFHVSASDAKGPNNYPFWIRTKPLSGISTQYDYNNGVINNGDEFGNITFTVPYNAPNTLYYVCQNSANMVGIFNIVNSLETPIDLITSTLTYPAIIHSSSMASVQVDVLNAYDQLTNNIALIQAETLAFVSSSWSSVYYNEASCSRDISYIINGVAKDLLYGGNEESIRSGLYYYLYPSQATGYEKSATLTAVKYASKLALNIISNKKLEFPDVEKEAIAECIVYNREFIQKETIAYLSSSWSGGDGFIYNEISCSRDVGYILDAVATDLKYGGNERSITAGQYYYLYPSVATVAGVPSSAKQLEPTLNGIRFAAGVVLNLIKNKTFNTPIATTQATVDLLKANKELIQNETIQYIGVAYPQLTYNTSKCRRDVGYIIDAIATDLLYGGNERSVIAGKNYYNYPSVATTTQKKETSGAIRYTKIISDYIAQNIILDTPRIVNNDEKGIKVTSLNNYKSSISGTESESKLISSSFQIVEGIIKKGINEIPSIISESNIQYTSNTDANIAVTNTQQYTSSLSASANEITKISSSFSIVTEIIENGLEVTPTIILTTQAAIGITGINQITSPIVANEQQLDNITSSFNLIRDIIYYGENGLADALARNDEYYGITSNVISPKHLTSISQSIGAGTYNGTDLINVSSSYGNIINIVNNGLGAIPHIIENTSSSLNITGGTPFKANYDANTTNIDSVSNSFGIILDIIQNQNYPTLVSNTYNGYFVTNTPQLISGSGAERLQAKLVSSSFAVVSDIILNGTGSQQFVSSSTTANTNPKITAAYNLLLGNEQFIIDETIAYMSSSWSTFDYNEAKCRRDLGYIIDGAAHDLLYGGNSGSYLNGLFYSLIPSPATASQLDQTLTAIGYASELAEKVVRNIELIAIDTYTSASYSSLLTNKQFIKNEVINYVSSSWSGFDYNEASCSRDVAYIVDAVATDLLYGGNQRSIIAGDYYFRYPSQATTSQLQPTLDSIIYAKGLALNLIKNNSFSEPNPFTQYSYNTIQSNRTFIQDEVIAFVNARYPNLLYNQTKCRRDVGYIVDAVSTDLLYGGNQRSSKAGEFYYKYPSVATSLQLTETTKAIEYAGLLTNLIIQDILLPTPQVISNSTPSTNTDLVDIYNTLLNNIPFIQSETIAYLSASWSDVYYNQSSCSRDIGYIVNAVATDFLCGGNEQSANAGIAYFATASNATTGSQLAPTLDAINFAAGTAVNLVKNIIYTTASLSVSASVNLLKHNREFIQNETMAWLDSAWSFYNYSKDKCKRDVGYILDGVITDLQYGGNERSTLSGQYYYKYPSQAISTQALQTNEGINYASRITQKVVQNIVFGTASLEVSASYDLLRNNKAFIAAETIAYVSSSWSGVYYNEASCSRDIQYIIDAAATDLLYGGQERAITAGTYYYIYPSKATKAGVPSESNQLDPTITGVKYGGRLASRIIFNPTFQYPSQSAVYGKELLVGNKTFVQKETLAFLSSSWSTLQYNEVSCSRDLGFIIDAVATDLIYGGNERGIQAGSYYYLIPSVAIQPSYTSNGKFGQKQQTVDGINYAAGISNKLIVQTQLVKPKDKKKLAAQRLLASKKDLAFQAISYTNGAFPYLTYNEASCSRDTGLIIDACVTDLIYGGNERGIAAASSYYTGQYGSATAVTSEQLLETLETNRYLRTRAEFIVANAPLESFGSLIVATGIDFSYNGAGVTFKALPPNQGGNGVPNPDYYITELGGGRIYFTSGDQNGNFNIGTGLTINQSTGTLVGRTFNKSLFALVTPYSLALQI